MYDFTSTGYQANVNQGSGSGSKVLDPTGRWVDSESAEGRAYWNNARTQAVAKDKAELAAQTNLATAEVDADAQTYEAEQNRTQGNQAFQYALSQAGGRRQAGGGIARGGAGRRGMSLNAATGGLAAANAAARRRTQGALASARVAASPRTQELQSQIAANSAKTY
jgi:hypothetical protein